MANPVVLFLCTGNSARSQMAEAFLRKHAGDRFEAQSAGTDPKPVHPLTIEVLREVGIDWQQAASKPFQPFLGRLPVRYLVVVCSEADQHCPTVWPGAYQRLFWPFDDPARPAETAEEQMARFRTVRDQIEKRILDWLKESSRAAPS